MEVLGKTLRTWPWAIGVLLWASVAGAGNDDAFHIGSEASMAGGAVVATINSGAALYYNPAGLGSAHHDSISLSGSVYTLRLYRTPAMLTTVNGEVAEARVREFVVVPTAFSYVRALSERLRLGVGVFVPQSSDWSHTAQLRGQDVMDQPRRWLISIDEERTEYRGMLGFGYRVSSRLSVGAALQAVYDSRDRAFVFSSVPEDGSPGIQAYRTLSDTGIGAGLSFGVQWRPTDALSFGASVRSPIVHLYSRASRLALTADTEEPELEATSDSGAGFEVAAPTRIRIGFAYSQPTFSLRFDGDFQHRLSNSEVSVERRRVINARLGLLWFVRPQWTLGFGAFTDRSPQTSPGTDPTERQVNFYGGTFGVAYGRERRLDPEHEEAPAIAFRSTFALRYAYGIGETVGFLLNEASPLNSRHDVHELGFYVGASMSY